MASIFSQLLLCMKSNSQRRKCQETVNRGPPIGNCFGYAALICDGFFYRHNVRTLKIECAPSNAKFPASVRPLPPSFSFHVPLRFTIKMAVIVANPRRQFFCLEINMEIDRERKKGALLTGSIEHRRENRKCDAARAV